MLLVLALVYGATYNIPLTPRNLGDYDDDDLWTDDDDLYGDDDTDDWRNL